MQADSHPQQAPCGLHFKPRTQAQLARTMRSTCSTMVRSHYDLLLPHDQVTEKERREAAAEGADPTQSQASQAQDKGRVHSKTKDAAYSRRMRTLVQEGQHTPAQILEKLRVEHPLTKAISHQRLQQVLQRELDHLHRQGPVNANSVTGPPKQEQQDQETKQQPGRKRHAEHSLRIDELMQKGHPPKARVFAQLRREYPKVRPARLRELISKAAKRTANCCSHCNGVMVDGHCSDAACRAARAKEAKQRRATATAASRGPIARPRFCLDCKALLLRQRIVRCQKRRSTAAKRARSKDWSLRMQRAGVKLKRVDKQGVLHTEYASNRDLTIHIEELKRGTWCGRKQSADCARATGSKKGTKPAVGRGCSMMKLVRECRKSCEPAWLLGMPRCGAHLRRRAPSGTSKWRAVKEKEVELPLHSQEAMLLNIWSDRFERKPCFNVTMRQKLLNDFVSERGPLEVATGWQGLECQESDPSKTRLN